SYTIAVSNAGPSAATGVIVTDVLPAGMTYVSAAGPGWGCSASGATVLCTAASIPVGAAPAITIVAIPMTTGTMTATGMVTSTSADPISANNHATTDTNGTAGDDEFGVSGGGCAAGGAPGGGTGALLLVAFALVTRRRRRAHAALATGVLALAATAILVAPARAQLSGTPQ